MLSLTKQLHNLLDAGTLSHLQAADALPHQLLSVLQFRRLNYGLASPQSPVTRTSLGAAPCICWHSLPSWGRKVPKD